MVDKEQFIKEYDMKMLEKYGCDAEYVYDMYYAKIYPYLGTIRHYRAKEENLTEREIRQVLGVGSKVWKASKLGFREFGSALKAKKSLKKFQSELILDKSVQEKLNAKGAELYLQMYNDDFKPKGMEVEVELPKTLEIKVQNHKKTKEELEQYAPDDLE